MVVVANSLQVLPSQRLPQSECSTRADAMTQLPPVSFAAPSVLCLLMEQEYRQRFGSLVDFGVAGCHSVT